jgi:hypothetical protein
MRKKNKRKKKRDEDDEEEKKIARTSPDSKSPHPDRLEYENDYDDELHRFI